jgi:hypothetical protein
VERDLRGGGLSGHAPSAVTMGGGISAAVRCTLSVDSDCWKHGEIGQNISGQEERNRHTWKNSQLSSEQSNLMIKIDQNSSE